MVAHKLLRLGGGGGGLAFFSIIGVLFNRRAIIVGGAEDGDMVVPHRQPPLHAGARGLSCPGAAAVPAEAAPASDSPGLQVTRTPGAVCSCSPGCPL